MQCVQVNTQIEYFDYTAGIVHQVSNIKQTRMAPRSHLSAACLFSTHPTLLETDLLGVQATSRAMAIISYAEIRLSCNKPSTCEL